MSKISLSEGSDPRCLASQKIGQSETTYACQSLRACGFANIELANVAPGGVALKLSEKVEVRDENNFLLNRDT